MQVPPQEKEVGMEVFFTPYKGIGGVIKQFPEDFVVEEVPILPPPGDGNYTIAFVEAKNWETHQLIYRMARSLGISEQAIGIAGIKDKRAVTKQAMSFQCPMEKLRGLSLPRVRVGILYRSYHPISRGELIGNIFRVKIRDADIDEERIRRISEDIEKAGGFPNFFGIQRFGIIRPVTHLVGKSIIEGNFKEAVKHYIAYPTEHEKEPERKARAFFHETEDFKEAIKLYPDHLHFEKAILNKLIESNGDYIEALKILPFNLLTMFVYAYQSYIFNRILSERIRKGLPIDKAVEGDIIMPFNKNMFRENELIPVNRRNIEKVNREIAKGKAYVTGLLVGYDSVFAEGEMGEIEHRIIEEEKIDTRNFIIPEIPSLSSSGSRRSLLAPLDNLEWKINKDEINEGKLRVDFKFELIKGSYATSLLREFMKSNDITNY